MSSSKRNRSRLPQKAQLPRLPWKIQAGRQTLTLDGVTIVICLANHGVRYLIDDVERDYAYVPDGDSPTVYMDALAERVARCYMAGIWPPD